jgi:hypothetical protein
LEKDDERSFSGHVLRKGDGENGFGDEVVRKEAMGKVFALKELGADVTFLLVSLLTT